MTPLDCAGSYFCYLFRLLLQVDLLLLSILDYPLQYLDYSLKNFSLFFSFFILFYVIFYFYFDFIPFFLSSFTYEYVYRHVF